MDEDNLRSLVFYSLNINDIQTVAEEVLDRELTLSEIASVIDPISEQIGWYGVIEDVLREQFDVGDDEDDDEEEE
jgi:hypothetical protein